MTGLLCQVCAQPAETREGTVFVEWQRPGEQGSKPLDRITTDTPPRVRYLPARVAASLLISAG